MDIVVIQYCILFVMFMICLRDKMIANIKDFFLLYLLWECAPRFKPILHMLLPIL